MCSVGLNAGGASTQYAERAPMHCLLMRCKVFSGSACRNCLFCVQDKHQSTGTKQLGENFFVRGDGTRCYYFDPGEMAPLFQAAGFTLDAIKVGGVVAVWCRLPLVLS